MDIRLQHVDLPDFGLPAAQPTLNQALYEARLQRLRARMAEQKLDCVVVYGDREHNANIAYLCGYDPRFEEGLLIIRPSGTPALLVGNEGWGYAELAPLPVRRILYQTLSLLGQDRSRSRRLETILAEDRKSTRLNSSH